ncbi:unnamed protein product [Prunus brigantina]
MVKDDETVATPNTASVVIQFNNTMHIVTREKMGYIRGKEKAPAGINPKYDKLYAENQKVKS